MTNINIDKKFLQIFFGLFISNTALYIYSIIKFYKLGITTTNFSELILFAISGIINFPLNLVYTAIIGEQEFSIVGILIGIIASALYYLALTFLIINLSKTNIGNFLTEFLKPTKNKIALTVAFAISSIFFFIMLTACAMGGGCPDQNLLFNLILLIFEPIYFLEMNFNYYSTFQSFIFIGNAMIFYIYACIIVAILKMRKTNKTPQITSKKKA